MRSKLIAAAVSVIALALPATAMANGGGSPGAGGLGQAQLAGQSAITLQGALERKRPADRDEHERSGERVRRSPVGRRPAVWLRHAKGQPAAGRPVVERNADGRHAQRRRLEQRQPGRAQWGG